MKYIVNTEFIATLFVIAGLIGGYFNARNQMLLSYMIPCFFSSIRAILTAPELPNSMKSSMKNIVPRSI